jgi:hypothetical protein
MRCGTCGTWTSKAEKQAVSIIADIFGNCLPAVKASGEYVSNSVGFSVRQLFYYMAFP